MAITECNKIITLSYLDGFISGLIQDNTGGTKSVDYGGKLPTYCPTYSELTGGTYIQYYSEGASPSIDTDGIYIDGSYASNQCVEQGDLKVKYTRFGSLAITANPTTADSCNDSTVTMNNTLTFTRFSRSNNVSCTSTAETSTSVTDTTATVTWSASVGTFSSNVLTIPAIGGSGGDRTITVSGTTMFRGTNNTQTTTITQSGSCCGCNDFSLSTTALTFEYSSTTAQPVTVTTAACINNITATPSASFSANFDGNNTINIAPTSTNTGATDITGTVTVNYNADSTTCTVKTISLTHKAKPCECDDLSLSTTALTFVSTATTANPQTVTVTTAACINNISVTCDSASFTTSFASNTITVKPVGENTGATDITGTVTVNYNASSTTCSKTISLKQNGSTCSCSDVTASTTSLTFAASPISSTTVTMSTAACISDFSVSISSGDSYFSASSSNNVITIGTKSENTSITDVRKGTAKVSFKAYGTACSDIPIELTQSARACDCTDFGITSSPSAFTSGQTTAQNVSYSAESCVTSVTASSSDSWLTVSVNTSSKQIVLTPTPNSGPARTSTVTVTPSVGGAACTSTAFTVMQDGSCECSGALTVSPTSHEWDYDSTSGLDVTITSGSCVSAGTIVATTGGSHFNATLGSGKVTITPNGQNTTNDDITETITITYSLVNGDSCTGSNAKTITVTHKGKPCGCDNLIIN